ncbi:MAG: bifunctional polysaccharide deacetylase/glycosyltransferase family 2 protein [Actinomycetota bacterium]|nr:bifunctional polysaccharide deacetylase/glycosyltransferase family 2 protein [Actinomycetota bacterium]
MALLILFQGVATHTVGASSEPHETGAGAPLAHSRPLLMARGGRLVSEQPAIGRRVALTFDDGPDPRWTPGVAAVLRREHVPGAFFVVGSQAARHPDLVRMLVKDGHEIGNHTFTHAALSGVSTWQARLQLELTEAVLVGITGHYARLVRPPYSATPDAITPAQQRRLAEIAGRRYLIALADLDSNDWQRKGVARIVQNATPRGSEGGVIMLHDGGGNRAQTVATLARLIPSLRSRGFQFVSLAQLAGVRESALSPVAARGQHGRGQVFSWSVRLAFLLVGILSAAVLLVGLLIAVRFALLVFLASHHVRATRRAPSDPSYRPSVTVIVPAYNEEVGIERAVRSLAGSDYEPLDVVVVDDGSQDATAAIVEGLGLSQVRLVRQDNLGKAAALNTGVRLSEAEIVVMVDGDTVFEPATVAHLVAPLADERVGAVSGNTKVGNRGGLLGRWQHIEYVTGFNLDRRMYEVLQCTPTVPGAAGAFRREALEAVGEVSSDTLAEDTDLTLAIGRTGRRVVYAPDARAWTEAPSTLGGLWRQRYRWSYGTMQAVWKHRRAVLTRDPRERRIGRRAVPYMACFQIVLPILSPLIDLFALYGVVFTNPVPVIGAWLGFNALQLALAVFAFRLDRESLRPLWALPLQQFVYRQLMYLVIIESTISALVGLRAQWKTIPRTGDVQVQPS